MVVACLLCFGLSSDVLIQSSKRLDVVVVVVVVVVSKLVWSFDHSLGAHDESVTNDARKRNCRSLFVLCYRCCYVGRNDILVASCEKHALKMQLQFELANSARKAQRAAASAHSDFCELFRSVLVRALMFAHVRSCACVLVCARIASYHIYVKSQQIILFVAIIIIIISHYSVQIYIYINIYIAIVY